MSKGFFFFRKAAKIKTFFYRERKKIEKKILIKPPKALMRKKLRNIGPNFFSA